MVNKLIKDSFFAHKEMVDNPDNRAETRWLKKEVEDYLILYDGSSLENVQVTNKNPEHMASIELSKKYVIHEYSLLAIASTRIENINPRPIFSIKINLGKLDLSKYNRIRANVYIESVGFKNFYFHFGFGNADSLTNHAPSLTPNQVNDVLWEVDKINRDKIEYITIAPFLMGCPPEAEPLLKVYIRDIRAEIVPAEYELGWKLEDRIAFCHSGYFVNHKKRAIAQNLKSDSFSIYDESKELAYLGKVKEEFGLNGKYNVLDFSDFMIRVDIKLK